MTANPRPNSSSNSIVRQRTRSSASRTRLRSFLANSSSRHCGRLNRLPRLQQRTPRNLQTAVALLLQRVHRFPGFAIVVDDVDALGDVAADGARFAEFKTLVAVDR